LQFTKVPDAETLDALHAFRAEREKIWDEYELSPQKASDWVTLALQLDITMRRLLIAFGVPFRNVPAKESDHNQGA
jgi:hypothetical protein